MSDHGNHTERVAVMMTKAEVMAVDDFRFTNRIGTRSEAIRRLCALGRRAAENRAEALSELAKLDGDHL